ncbi:TetR/AcrR family transcriptional regulator [Saccharibacillus kuerlensis]|uniref:HTH-type transcriptional regulator YxaF n=1 Tax=Saccharibacillus kuerlensis TaxID=459527 RepID=A0ABQ2L7Y6_9BACL|nr:TetR/AcrR family transcriptional regulator [Saccharibacillus kuerlensis]GGO06248.1 putative HTH-type transcriptional regulator YxaF [Saccharibacillus kuerlensis]
MSAKKNTRDTILETAGRLFFTQGYHATGLNQIIKESEAPKGSLYYHFQGGKEELALECIQRIGKEVANTFWSKLNDQSTAAESLPIMMTELAEEMERQKFGGFMPFSFWAAVETSCVSHSLREACTDVFRSWQMVLADKLEEDGAARKTAEDLALMLITMMEGTLMVATTTRDATPLLTAAKYIPDLIKQHSRQ